MITLYAVRDKNTGKMGHELPGSLSGVCRTERACKANITKFQRGPETTARELGLKWAPFDLEVVELKCYAADEAIPVETTSLERVKVEVKGTEDELLRCRKCGKAVVWEYPFCPECGRKVEAE